MAFITPNQLHIARSSLGWSFGKLAARAGVATNSAISAESGGDCRMSTIRALADAMMAEGILFFADGSVGQRMSWIDGKPADQRVAKAALLYLNADRKSAGKCPLIDEEGGA